MSPERGTWSPKKEGRVLQRMSETSVEGCPGCPSVPILGTGAIEKIIDFHIFMVLRKHGGNKARAAKELGIHRQSLQRRLKRAQSTI